MSLILFPGSIYDFEAVPGLASFVAHMLMTPSKKNKQAYSFEKFIHLHGGNLQKPTTNEEDTSFSFDVDYIHFLSALNR